MGITICVHILCLILHIIELEYFSYQWEKVMKGFLIVEQDLVVRRPLFTHSSEAAGPIETKV